MYPIIPMMTPMLIPVVPGVRRGSDRVKKLQKEAAEAEVGSESLPKSFEYFCPACLYQTNEFTVLCPKCGKEGLKDSGKDRFRRI